MASTAPRSLLPSRGAGLSAPQVTVPNGPLTGEWFREFITNYLNPYALQGTQGEAQVSATPAAPFTTAINSPVNGTMVVTAAAGTAQSAWQPGATVALPGPVGLNVIANGGVVDVLFNQTGAWGNGYVFRFDARNGKVAGQILKMTGGTMTAIGTAVAAANTEALGGVYRVVMLVGLSGALSIFVDGALQTKATDTSYSLSGATYLATEIVGHNTVSAPTAIDGTLDMVADGVQYVHLASGHAAANVAFNFQGVWASGNPYVKGDEVVYGQTYWLAVANSTNSAPSTSNVNWQAVASYNAYQGAWSAATGYVVGDEVTYSGNYWVCIAANVNSAPTTSNANWQIAGPSSLDNIADGTVYQRTPVATFNNWVTQGPAVIAGAGTVVTKNENTNGWDTSAYTQNALYGGGSLTWQVTSLSAFVMGGFSLSPTSAISYAALTWGLYQNNGTYAIFSNGTSLGAVGSAAAVGDVLQLTYDGITVRVLCNGVLIYSARDPNRLFYAKMCLYNANGSVSSIAVGLREPLAQASGNLMPNYCWKIGTTGSQASFVDIAAGSTPSGIDLGGGGGYPLGPYGTSEPLWRATGGYNGANGGWNNTIDLANGAYDPTKTYRFAVWVWWNGTGTAGSIYFGCDTAYTNDIGGTHDTNPYFLHAYPSVSLTASRWYLLVGVIHGAGYTGSSSGLSGLYDPTTGKQLVVGSDFVCTSGALQQTMRAYYYYETNASAYVLFAEPRVEEVTINTLSIQQILASSTDGLIDGNNFIRMPAPPAVSAGSVNGSLAQSGTTTTINVAASTFYLGTQTASLNSGSVNPGAYGTYYVYADLPNYVGGAVTYHATTAPGVLSQSPWRFGLGVVTTLSGGGGSGGGGAPPCFSGDTRVLTADGYRRFDELPAEFEIVNHTGRHQAKLLVHAASMEPMRRMGAHLVTQGHLMLVGSGWVPARELFHECVPTMPRTVYNMHVVSDDPRDLHYLLENGLTAHNRKMS